MAWTRSGTNSRSPWRTCKASSSSGPRAVAANRGSFAQETCRFTQDTTFRVSWHHSLRQNSFRTYVALLCGTAQPSSNSAKQLPPIVQVKAKQKVGWRNFSNSAACPRCKLLQRLQIQLRCAYGRLECWMLVAEGFQIRCTTHIVPSQYLQCCRIFGR